MKILLYSSPYQYYVDNLIPLAQYFEHQGHQVYGSYKLSIDGEEIPMLDTEKITKPDVILLTQTWWYRDAEIAKNCKVPLYVIDHAPPMMRFTQPDGKKSHLYRKDNLRQHYISWGQTTVDIMKEVGYRGRNKVLGSSRVESVLDSITESREGYVLFDTSSRMEDDELVAGFVKFVKQHPDQQFIIQEHSRSSGCYRVALEYPNVKLNNDLKEHQLFAYSNFIFTFPSSAMIIPALQNKRIFGLYEKHFCLEARNYFKKYKDCIFNLKEQDVIPNFKQFINSNILYKREESANQRIYKYITEGK